MTGTAVLTVPADAHELTTICCHCHRVQTADGQWEPRFVPKGELVSHGICRECFAEFYPGVPLPKPNR